MARVDNSKAFNALNGEGIGIKVGDLDCVLTLEKDLIHVRTTGGDHVQLLRAVLNRIAQDLQKDYPGLAKLVREHKMSSNIKVRSISTNKALGDAFEFYVGQALIQSKGYSGGGLNFDEAAFAGKLNAATKNTIRIAAENAVAKWTAQNKGSFFFEHKGAGSPVGDFILYSDAAKQNPIFVIECKFKSNAKNDIFNWRPSYQLIEYAEQTKELNKMALWRKGKEEFRTNIWVGNLMRAAVTLDKGGFSQEISGVNGKKDVKEFFKWLCYKGQRSFLGDAQKSLFVGFPEIKMSDTYAEVSAVIDYGAQVAKFTDKNAPSMKIEKSSSGKTVYFSSGGSRLGSWYVTSGGKDVLEANSHTRAPGSNQSVQFVFMLTRNFETL